MVAVVSGADGETAAKLVSESVHVKMVGVMSVSPCATWYRLLAKMTRRSQSMHTCFESLCVGVMIQLRLQRKGLGTLFPKILFFRLKGFLKIAIIYSTLKY